MSDSRNFEGVDNSPESLHGRGEGSEAGRDEENADVTQQGCQQRQGVVNTWREREEGRENSGCKTNVAHTYSVRGGVLHAMS